MYFDVGGIEDHRGMAKIGRCVQVLLHLGLAVRHEVGANVTINVDEERFVSTPHQRGSIVNIALGLHPGVKSSGAEYFDRSPFEYACSGSVQNVVPTGPFDHD